MPSTNTQDIIVVTMFVWDSRTDAETLWKQCLRPLRWRRHNKCCIKSHMSLLSHKIKFAIRNAWVPWPRGRMERSRVVPASSIFWAVGKSSVQKCKIRCWKLHILHISDVWQTYEGRSI